jgi:hypothetical protein
MHMSDLMSTLVRTIVSSVLSLSLIVILALPWTSRVRRCCWHRSGTYSTISAISVAIIPTPMVDLDHGLVHHRFLLVVHLHVRRHQWNTWFQSPPGGVALAPCSAAAFFTSTFSWAPPSHLGQRQHQPQALPACLMMRL